MAIVTPGKIFTANEIVTPTNLNALGVPTVTNIVNADISASAAITDTKLATISSAGKVANSATTATSANIPNSIVARDDNGKVAVALANSVITDEPSITDADSNDVILLYDTSASGIRKITIDNLMIKINNVPYLEYAWVTAPNSSGQSIAANVVTTLTLNSEVADTAGIGSLSSNRVTIPSGTYRYLVEVPCSVSYFEGQIYIKNTNTNLFLAKHKWIGPSAGNTGMYDTYYPYHPLNGPFEGQFSLAAQSAIELQFLASSGVSIGINTGSYTIRSTVATADLDQRTTIKLWKVG